MRPELTALAEEWLKVDTDAQGWAHGNFVDDPDWESPDCDVMSRKFITWLETRGVTGRLVHVQPPEDAGATGWYSDHWFVDVDGVAVDWTAKQFYNVPQPPISPKGIACPLVFPWPGTYPLTIVQFKEV